MNDLTAKKCLPCEIGGPPLPEKKVVELLAKVPEWKPIKDGRKIAREFEFKNFAEALAFANLVGAIAEEEGHHPDISIYSYKYMRIELYTFAVNGLSENDFILAAKIDALGP